jgi:hypothetical protein
MAKSQSAKLNDATRNEAKYYCLTEAQKKIRNQKSNERRKLRSAKLKFAQIRTAAEALISIKKEADTNSKRSKRWRDKNGHSIASITKPAVIWDAWSINFPVTI